MFRQEKQKFVPSKGTIYRIVKKFRENGSVIDGPRHRPKVMDERKVEKIKQILAENPKISIKELSSQVNMGFTSLFRLRQDYPNELGSLTNRMRTLKNDEKSKSMIRFGRGIRLSEEHIEAIKRILVEHPTYTAAQVADLVGVSRKNKVLVEMRNKYLSEHGIRIPKVKKNTKSKSDKSLITENAQEHAQKSDLAAENHHHSSLLSYSDLLDSEWSSFFDLPQANSNMGNGYTLQPDLELHDHQQSTNSGYPVQELTEMQCFYVDDLMAPSAAASYVSMINCTDHNQNISTSVEEETATTRLISIASSALEFNYSDFSLNQGNFSSSTYY